LTNINNFENQYDDMRTRTTFWSASLFDSITKLLTSLLAFQNIGDKFHVVFCKKNTLYN